MPAYPIVYADVIKPTVIVQFTDGNDNPVSAPAGAKVSFASDNQSSIGIEVDPANPLKGNVSIANPDSLPESGAYATVTIEITGVNDVNGEPYSTMKFYVNLIPPVPAQPARLLMQFSNN